MNVPKKIEDYSFEEIKKGFRENDQKVLIAFINYVQKVGPYILQELGNEKIVNFKEVRQKVCEAFYKRCLDEEKGEVENVKAFVRIVIRNKIIDEFRKKKFWKDIDTLEGKILEPVFNNLEQEENRSFLFSILESMGEPCQTILTKRLLESWEYEALANLLDESYDNIRQLFHRCKKKFATLVRANPQFTDLI